ncbi:MAG TPA: hypothetical protein VD772_00720, partial [Anseongella sp.]|nr:hypothetical protein [Anseongella sp.]
GAREVVFLFGARYFQFQEHQAIAISLLFFAITAAVSLCGIYFSFSNKVLGAGPDAGAPGKKE